MLPDREEIADRRGRIKAYEAVLSWLGRGYGREELKRQVTERISSNRGRIERMRRRIDEDAYPPF